MLNYFFYHFCHLLSSFDFSCLPRSASVQMGEEPLIVILAILVVVSVIAVISCIYAYHKRKENQKLQEEISGIQQGENEDLNHQNSQN